MRLTAGSRLGAYEIVALLGSGGMGEVYRARDPRLGRDVALKVLAPELARDKDALGRFEREAKTASGLNHPHIVHIYEIGEAPTPSGPAPYIAMELVEGETLRARLRSGTGWRSLLEPLAQAADALARAHKAGIVHRDLKPENVMITPDGYPKVVDFGLAKLTESTAAAAPESTPTASIEGRTGVGVIVGTPSYMSPEQAQSKPVDQRSDVFSFGCILYEATAARRPFVGGSQVAMLHAIVYDEPPPIESFNPEAPAELRRIIRRCLAKDPEQRYQTIKDVANDLRDLAREPASRPASTATRAFAPETKLAVGLTPSGRWLTWGVVAAVTVAVVVAGLQWRGGRVTDAARRLPTSAIRVEKLTSRGDASNPAISPDGRYLVYTSREEGRLVIWLRDIGEGTETRLVGPIDTDNLEFGPFSMIRFAKDGRAVYYELTPKGSGRRDLYRVPLIGGDPRLIRTDARIDQLSPDMKHLAFTRGQDDKTVLVMADAEGGQEKKIGEVAAALAWSPDGSRFLFSRVKDGKHTLFVVSADGTGEKEVGALAQAPIVIWWKPAGDGILCALEKNDRGFTLFELDLATRATKPLGDRLWHYISALYWLPDASGLVVHELGGPENSALWFVSYPEGKVERMPADTHNYWGLGITADGTRIVSVLTTNRSDLLVSSDLEKGTFKKIARGTDVTYRFCWTIDGKIVYSSNEGGSYDLYVVDADGANRKQLTFDRTSDETEPAASPDGRYIVFVSDRSDRTAASGLYRINRDGTGLRSLTPSPKRDHPDGDPQFTPDSQWVFYEHWDNGSTLWKVPIDGGTPVLVKGARPPVPPAPMEHAFGASVSPDGKSLAFLYRTDDPKDGASATDVVVASLDGRIVKRFPYRAQKTREIEADARVQWSRDGSALYYENEDETGLWRRPLAGGSLARVAHLEGALIYFDWSLDGKTLACSRSSGQNDVVMITNFH